MRKLVSLLLLGLVVPMICFAQGGPSPLQMVFVLKKVFPEVKDVYVFLDKNKVESVKSKFNQAGIANSVKIKLHPIQSLPVSFSMPPKRPKITFSSRGKFS